MNGKELLSQRKEAVAILSDLILSDAERADSIYVSEYKDVLPEETYLTIKYRLLSQKDDERRNSLIAAQKMKERTLDKHPRWSRVAPELQRFLQRKVAARMDKVKNKDTPVMEPHRHCEIDGPIRVPFGCKFPRYF